VTAAVNDVTLFTFGRRLRCDCGAWVDLAVGHQQTCEDVEQVPQQDTMPRSMEQPIALVGDTTMTTQISGLKLGDQSEREQLVDIGMDIATQLAETLDIRTPASVD
jgi:hypothetical protein